jgi:hypothetical protein
VLLLPPGTTFLSHAKPPSLFGAQQHEQDTTNSTAATSFVYAMNLRSSNAIMPEPFLTHLLLCANKP